MVLSYDVSLGHIMSHIVVFDVEHPRRKSENTNYLTQLSEAKANTFHKKACLASLLNKGRDSSSQDQLFLINSIRN